MAHIEKHAPGTFCWIELATTDQNAAKQFYGSVFGWSANDSEMGPNEFYTMFQLDGRDAAAAYGLRPEQRAQGIPPHWMIYVSVDSADATAGRVTPLGGEVVAPPFDVMNFGRMAVLRDPQGAMFSIWEPKTHIGTRITGVDGTLCWADLNTPDPEAAGKFYGSLFGWELESGSTGYRHLKNGEEPIGGIPPGRPDSPPAPAHWMPYFLTSRADATAAKADSAGSRLFMPPTSMENVGRIAIISDPQGAVFAIFEPSLAA